MSTDIAQALELANAPFTEQRVRDCIRSLVADIEERDMTIWSLRENLRNEAAQLAERDRRLAELDEFFTDAGLVKDMQEELRLCQQEAIGYRDQLAQAREALRGLLEHFMWRYCRTKKEGKEYTLPPQVLAAQAALAQAGEKTDG